MPIIVIVLPIVVVLVSLSLRVVKEYDRGVIFFLGKYTGVRGPGLIILIPVLEDALHRSLSLAAAMDSRGYGRSAHVPVRDRRLTGVLVIGGLIGICIGAYGVLDETVPPPLGLPMLIAGTLAAVFGFALGGRRLDRTTYRPDPWTGAETLVAASGIAAVVFVFVAGVVDPGALQPSIVPLAWPELSPLATVGILIAALPAWLAPPVGWRADVTLARSATRG